LDRLSFHARPAWFTVDADTDFHLIVPMSKVGLPAAAQYRRSRPCPIDALALTLRQMSGHLWQGHTLFGSGPADFFGDDGDAHPTPSAV